MASGAILATCPLCGEFIWEDEDYRVSDSLYHTGCPKYAQVIEIEDLLLSLSRANQERVLSYLLGILSND